MNKNRYIFQDVIELALSQKKMAFVSGPRQVGKTTFAKHLSQTLNAETLYCNWDDKNFRKKWVQSPSSVLEAKPKVALLILDELHKAKFWKRDLKGLFDLHHDECQIIVTGSARLNTFKKGGDSLLGRYFQFRLHPFSVGEIINPGTQQNPSVCLANMFDKAELFAYANDQVEKLLKFGGFPDPYFQATERHLNLWHQGRIEKIVREDLRDLSRIPELSQIEMLTAMLPEKIGHVFSVSSLREDLEVSYNTVKRWLLYLEQLYYFFSIKPFSKGVTRSLKKEPKIYLWDWSEVPELPQRFENMVASCLLKACDFWTDLGYGMHHLCYLRNKQKAEVDFLITCKNKPVFSVEVKMTDSTIDRNFLVFAKSIGIKKHLQIVHQPGIWRKSNIENCDVLVASAEFVMPHLP